MLARAGGALARVPVVISSIHSENFGGSLRRLALAWTDSFASVTTVVSQRVGERLVRLGAAPARVRVIPNGIDTNAVGPHLRVGRTAVRRAIGVRDDAFLWLAAGRLEEPKDYPNLIAATAQLAAAWPHMALAIAGQGPLFEDIRADVARRGLERVVTLLGIRDDVPACMAAADAMVLASAWEGLPNVIIESLAVGTPVVSTDVGGVREVVQHGASGFVVPPRNADALAAAMARMMTLSAAERTHMGAIGCEHVQQHFTLEGVLRDWSGLFNELFARPA
jgi:glycosyltransferase involved in cell wall biosynthesis